MAPRDDSPAAGGPTNWLKSNLAAIGSVAVLTVYAVGFFKTKDAAARFAADAAARRPPRRNATTGPQPGGTFTPARRGETAAPTPASAPSQSVSAESGVADNAIAGDAPSGEAESHAETPSADEPKNATTVAKAVTPATPSTSTAAAPATSEPAAKKTATAPAPSTAAPSTAAPVTTPASGSAKAATTVATKPASGSTPVSAAAALPTTPRTAAPPAPAPAAAPAPTPAPVDTGPIILKDGLFYGYGTSRHGDIQAAVEILNHRILSVYITECLTQYSCSWIKNLPDEVVKIQSAETNYVSGATASSDAFYYAVVDALKKAR